MPVAKDWSGNYAGTTTLVAWDAWKSSRLPSPKRVARHPNLTTAQLWKAYHPGSSDNDADSTQEEKMHKGYQAWLKPLEDEILSTSLAWTVWKAAWAKAREQVDSVEICSSISEKWFAYRCGFKGPYFDTEKQAEEWARDQGYSVKT